MPPPTVPLPKVLVVEDDPAGARMMGALLRSEGCEVLHADGGRKALETVRDTPGLAAVFLDLGLPDLHGMKVLEELKAARPSLPVVILSGDGEIQSAVQATKLGAINYFLKPIDTTQIAAVLRQLLEQAKLRAEVADLKDRLGGLPRLMGPGPKVRALQDRVREVADSPLTVLIQGETGSGKELVARAVHDFSSRATRPFIALDCGAIPEALLESELFGHEKGAFSGADRRKEGLFQLAQGGTLFLDEVANLPLALQAKLLRVLEERSLRPVGALRGVEIDVRFVAAANADLEAASAAGRFRLDLFYRLAEYRLEVPPLRERLEDLPSLAQRFLEEAGVELRRPVRQIAPEALERLLAHNWPGNVRELRNVVRRAVLQAKGGVLEGEDLPALGAGAPPPPAGEVAEAAPPPAAPGRLSLREAARLAAEAAEERAIREALAESGGNILRASRALQTDNKTLHGKLKKFGLKAKDAGGAA